ncbi:MAG: SpoIIE family protein phosphatase [Candidatus Eisenbacteria bacterium]|nr:SpoIIE family protein phosphatase [Candidatus Eisenbacteria bacterium]
MTQRLWEGRVTMSTRQDRRAGSTRPRRLKARTVFLWALFNSLAGLAIGGAIKLFADGSSSAHALIPMSIVFANVVGFAAVLTVRYVFPKYSGFPGYVRLPMGVLTLVAAGVFGSGVAILVNPLVVFYQMRLALMAVTVNGVLALAVGFVVYTYEQMRGRIEEEASARGRLEHEMNVARDIQMELLPKTFPNLAGLDIYGFSVPARHVGGDCYDIIDLGDGRLAFTIGDVSGKGTPAALLMANVQAAVRALADSGARPSDLIRRVNRIVHGYTKESVFITFFYGVLDSGTGECLYVNAGHNPPCVMRAGGDREHLTEGGLVVGAMPGTTYDEGRCRLGPGDEVVLYTDGITEATNPADEMFGEERLMELLDINRSLSAREIEERVYSSLRDFTEGAPQSDDLTMVIIKLASGIGTSEADSDSDSPREAEGGLSAARGASSTDALREPAKAVERAENALLS